MEVGILRSQPFTNSHFRFLIVVKSATSPLPQVLRQRPTQIISRQV
jgi:hypothetical protein